MIKNKSRGFIFFSKKIKDNDLYIRVLSSNDEIDSGIVFGGNSSKKKLTYQNGYFIEYTVSKKNESSPPVFLAELSKPYIGNIYNDKYKMNAYLSILSIINLSILEGQKIKDFFNDVEILINTIINQNHWIISYFVWLFNLLKIIGYEVDYKNNAEKKYYNILEQKFTNQLTSSSIKFPHKLFIGFKHINYDNIKTIFLIFESIYIKNHLDNINYKMPVNFINFKNMIIRRLKT